MTSMNTSDMKVYDMNVRAIGRFFVAMSWRKTVLEAVDYDGRHSLRHPSRRLRMPKRGRIGFEPGCVM